MMNLTKILKPSSFCLVIFMFSVNSYGQQGFREGEYFILDDNINIRSEPNTNSRIIGKLHLHDRIMVLETTNIKSNIENMNEYWCKIKYDNIIGYIYGGYIARQTIMYDIDHNGIEDYFYLRYSYNAPKSFVNEHYVDMVQDIILYIDNKKVLPFYNYFGNDAHDFDRYSMETVMKLSEGLLIVCAGALEYEWPEFDFFVIDQYGEIIDRKFVKGENKGYEYSEYF